MVQTVFPNDVPIFVNKIIDECFDIHQDAVHSLSWQSPDLNIIEALWKVSALL